MFLFCAAMELCAFMGTSVRCAPMSADITTIEVTFPKGNEEETENQTLGHQKVSTLLNSEKNNCTGSEGCLHHCSDKPFSIC